MSAWIRIMALSAPIFALSVCPAAAQPITQHRAITGLASPDMAEGSSILTWSSPAPDAINMHIVLTSDGLILIDALRRADQVDDAHAIVRQLSEPVRAILLTHAHTDHYGGVRYWRAHFPGVPIYASKAIHDEIRDDLFPDNARRRAMFGSLFPTQQELDQHLPTDIVTDGVPFIVAGLTLTPLVMGPSESPAAVVYVVPERNSAFVGDLVNVLTVAAPTISLNAWLEQLTADCSNPSAAFHQQKQRNATMP